ncbi:hypothetical protein [Wolbachia endosymbiont of Chironomus riparius]|uniref:hypothetical protein n=1 Tax=Wolbachia endosymbiont of Chironomus riparius TaxID=2883238 RepID=UPI0020A14BEB|nr:hypothetical protein [Wolbachia endosymbiont of Chironomus riparius]
MSYITGEAEILDNKKYNNKNEDYLILKEPSYREQFLQYLYEAQKKGMDLVFLDERLIMIETKFSMYQYTWNKKRRIFERTKPGKDNN